MIQTTTSTGIAQNTLLYAPYFEPRYLVIANAPRLSYNIGRILTPIKEGSNFYDYADAPSSEVISYPEKYPAILRKLYWFEKEEMRICQILSYTLITLLRIMVFIK